MKTLIAPSERDETIRRWQGGVARVWLFHISLKRLALRIQRAAEPEVLYVIAIGCEHIHGPISWHHAKITITDERDSKTGENTCLVTDADADFRLRCSAAVLARGPEGEVDKSFEDFLGDFPTDSGVHSG